MEISRVDHELVTAIMLQAIKSKNCWQTTIRNILRRISFEGVVRTSRVIILKFPNNFFSVNNCAHPRDAICVGRRFAIVQNCVVPNILRTRTIWIRIGATYKCFFLIPFAIFLFKVEPDHVGKLISNHVGVINEHTRITAHIFYRWTLVIELFYGLVIGLSQHWKRESHNGEGGHESGKDLFNLRHSCSPTVFRATKRY